MKDYLSGMGYPSNLVEVKTPEGKQILKKLLDIHKALDESVIVAITNVQGVITYVNDKFQKISKYHRDELIGNTHRILNSGYHPRSFFKEMWRTISSGQVWTGEIKNRAKDGSTYWVSTTIVPFLNSDGKPFQYVAIRTDITARINMEKALQEALENDFQSTIKQLANLIFKIFRDEQGDYRFILAEGKIAELINFTTKKVQNKMIKELFPRDAANLIEQYVQEAYKGEHVSFELNVWSKDFLVHLSPIMKENKVKEIVGTTLDISERKRAEEKIKYMAYHDLMTGLPNRVQFMEIIAENIKLAEENKEVFSVMFLDLDRFKNINDTLGHHVGDELLKAFGRRLVRIVDGKGIVSRFGGDEFALLLPRMGETEAAQYAEQILQQFGTNFTVSDLDVYVTPSIGISIFPKDGHTPETLVKHADAAILGAKLRGRSNYSFFNQPLIEQINKKMVMENYLRKAVEENDLFLYYQPQVDVEDNKIVGVEALARWYHRELGNVPPSDFIPLAEETGLILPIGEWVLKTACQQNKNWQKIGLKPLTMAVNISMRQFMSHGFTDMVQRVLAETKLAPQYLELEVTESMTTDVDYTERVYCLN